MESPLNPDQHPQRTRSSKPNNGGDTARSPGNGGVISGDGFLVWQGSEGRPRRGRLGGGRLTIGWSAVATAFVLMAAAWVLGRRPGDSDLPSLALLGILMAAAGSTFQAGVHLLICHLHRSVPSTLILTAAGFRTIPDGFFGNWLIRQEMLPGQKGLPGQQATRPLRALSRQRLLEIACPPLALCLAVLGAWSIDWLWAGGWGSSQPAVLTERATSLGVVFRSPAEIAAWTWLFQAAWCMLPIPGCHGRTALEAAVSLVHVALPRPSETLAIVRQVDRIQSLLAILVVCVGVYLWQNESTTFSLPSWPFVLALGVLIWSGRKPSFRNRSSQTALPTELAQQEELLALPNTASNNGNASRTTRRIPKKLGILGKWRVRRAQRTERAEALDATRLDEVLDKMLAQGPESLSGVERRLLARVSRRLRENTGPAKKSDRDSQ